MFLKLLVLLIALSCIPFGSHAQWVRTNGPDNVFIFSSHVVDDINIFVGTNGRVFRSINNGGNWVVVDSGLPNYYTYYVSLAHKGAVLFAGTNDGKIFLSSNNGINWIDVSSGLPDSSITALIVIGSNIFARIRGSGVCISTNNGSSWSRVNSGLSNTFVNTLFASGTTLYAGTDGGVFRTSHGGSGWSAVNTGLTDTGVHTMEVSGNNIFAGTFYGGGIFLSTNEGTNSAPVNAGLLITDVTALIVNNTDLFAGIGSGVFRSSTNGKSWTVVNTGLLILSVTTFAVTSTNLFAGTLGDAVWRRPLSEMITSVDQQFSTLPKTFSLYQNYPNPFNPTIRIDFSLPISSFTILKIYDMLGMEIQTLVWSTLDAGSHSIEWNAANHTSGVYFYRLQSGNWDETKKLILLK